MPTEITAICVYCGSSSGNSHKYVEAAQELGEALVKNGIALVYGGGDKGLMGIIARTVHEGGGNVVGIIPKAMTQFEGMLLVGNVTIVPDMHTRKKKMEENCNAFIALPGGFGTFEELFEAITWAQLNIHSKPIGVLNTNGFYDPLIALIDRSIESGFIKPSNRELIVVRDNVSDLLTALREFKMPEDAQYNLDWRQAKELA
ncbi:hypothetical protein SpCBS45565_g05659 [Spizellomyces sp. 'palustris']|nr:hypothetical protein SpCBS45565_g05659 [Spizellomyces sp. 'palustris']